MQLPTCSCLILSYLELLIIDRTDEDIGTERFSRDAGSEEIFALIVVTVIYENFGNVFNLVTAESSTVVKFP